MKGGLVRVGSGARNPRARGPDRPSGSCAPLSTLPDTPWRTRITWKRFKTSGSVFRPYQEQYVLIPSALRKGRHLPSMHVAN
ncbi:hypothetical protein N7468_002339 [Penicillium chermesinum]|uniref:Uncharacterized protein n=1 Tax=Penicillium chermesinum TaxID=63820 RepID=A0A9W9TXF6_9EURO|nr:uncharacterized protein N7468_002339 [Penicillium chermesinum]KAJ5247356.1 hypothetical protein N7468_002339 [Penicillium chermesinum]